MRLTAPAALSTRLPEWVAGDLNLQKAAVFHMLVYIFWNISFTLAYSFLPQDAAPSTRMLLLVWGLAAVWYASHAVERALCGSYLSI